MNVTNDGFKYRQLHIEDYLQMVSAEQKEYAEVYAYQKITENNDTIPRNLDSRDKEWQIQAKPSSKGRDTKRT